MATISFAKMPTLQQWTQASSVTFAIRSSDLILTRIDKLMGWYCRSADNTEKLVIMCDLYFTTDYWLKMYKRNKHMDEKRQPAVYALFFRTAFELTKMFGCTINSLPRELELLWGRELTKDGVFVDVIKNMAEYITRAQAAPFRIWFKNGRAYEMHDGKLQRADSKNSYVPEAAVRNSPPAPDYGFFVLTMSRDLYMTKHRVYDPRDINPQGFYHSSYVAGSPVMCSGTMRIKNGVIERVRLNSGHYQPGINNVRALIMAFRMWALPETMLFEGYDGALLAGDGKMQSVVAATKSNGALDTGRMAALANNKLGFAKVPIDRSKMPDPRLQNPNRNARAPNGALLPSNWVHTDPPAVNAHLPA
jgi:hypothetical protein